MRSPLVDHIDSYFMDPTSYSALQKWARTCAVEAKRFQRAYDSDRGLLLPQAGRSAPGFPAALQRFTLIRRARS